MTVSVTVQTLVDGMDYADMLEMIDAIETKAQAMKAFALRHPKQPGEQLSAYVKRVRSYETLRFVKGCYDLQGG